MLSGETALDFAMSLSVFDETSSTWLAGVFAAVSLIPSIVIPVLAAPLVDRCSRKRIIVLMDSINSVLFLMFFVFMHYRGFNYNAYIIFQLVTGCAGSFYYLAYSALYPLLIPQGYTQKGYAVSGMIYPMVTAVMAPCSAIIYSALGLELKITISGKPAIIKNHHTVALNQANDQLDTEQQNVDGDGLWQAVRRSVSQYAKEISEGMMLFLAYPLMLAVRFMAGFLGVNSAALREAAVSRYLPNHMRARVNTVNNTMMQTAMLVVNMAVGALGEIMDYRYMAAALSCLSLAAIYFLIIRGRKDVEKVFAVHLDDVGAA